MEIISQHSMLLLVLACSFGFFMAWEISANDVALDGLISELSAPFFVLVNNTSCRRLPSHIFLFNI